MGDGSDGGGVVVLGVRMGVALLVVVVGRMMMMTMCRSLSQADGTADGQEEKKTGGRVGRKEEGGEAGKEECSRLCRGLTLLRRLTQLSFVVGNGMGMHVPQWGW